MVRRSLGQSQVNAIVVPVHHAALKANGKSVMLPWIYNLLAMVMPEGTTKPMDIRVRQAQLQKKTSEYRVFLLGTYLGKAIITLPTKMAWRGPEDLSLIRREVKRMLVGVEKRGWKYVAMLRPISDDKAWESFKEEFFGMLEKSTCRFGIYSGKAAPVEPKKEEEPVKYSGRFKDLPEEEKKKIRKAAAAKGRRTKEEKKRADAEAALKKEQDMRVKRIEAEISDVLEELVE